MKRDGAVLAVVVIAAIVGIATGDGYRLYVIAMVGLTAIVGIGLNVLIGLTGQISLGHVGFYAIGAYAVGILTTTASWSFWASLLAAGTIFNQPPGISRYSARRSIVYRPIASPHTASCWCRKDAKSFPSSMSSTISGSAVLRTGRTIRPVC